MDLASAIGEFADMLALGAQALEKLVQRERQDGLPASDDALVRETQAIAARLRDIADDLRQHKT